MIYPHLLLLAADAPSATPTAQTGPQGLLGGMVPFILIFVIFYFVLIRPQMKKQKEQQQKQQEMMNSMKSGDKVITSGGIHGILISVKETTVTMKIADNVKVEVDKAAITVVSKRGDDSDSAS